MAARFEGEPFLDGHALQVQWPKPAHLFEARDVQSICFYCVSHFLQCFIFYSFECFVRAKLRRGVVNNANFECHCVSQVNGLECNGSQVLGPWPRDGVCYVLAPSSDARSP